MTKNRSIKIAVLVLALALITSCFVGTTFAKYQSTATAEGTAVQVAKWAFTGSLDNASDTTFDFDLFATITGYDTGDESQTSTQDAEVAEDRIAPGTKGAAEFTLTNASEVDAEIAFALDVSDFDGLPLTFVYKINDVVVADDPDTDDADELEQALSAIAFDMGDTVTVVVEWSWAFDALGNNDTALGTDTNVTDAVRESSASVTVTQKN